MKSFLTALPEAKIYVINNASTDRTEALAKELLGPSLVINEPKPGKADAVRRAFHDIHADVYVMVDADMTYPAEEVHNLINPIVAGDADMVVGDRLSSGAYQKENKRQFHQFGNHLVRQVINVSLGSQLNDVMSGFRAFNRKFVKLYPILCHGFEIETDMTLHAVHKRFRILEVPIKYQDRPPGSESKLSTFKDGFKVLFIIFSILKDYKPLTFFGSFAIIFFLLGLSLGLPVVIEFMHSGYITKVPSAILSTGLMIFSIVATSVGLMLHTVTRFHQLDFERQLMNFDQPYSK